MKRASIWVMVLIAGWVIGGCAHEHYPDPVARTGPQVPVTRSGRALTLEGQSLTVGDKAPDATLLDRGYREVKLSSMWGKVVLLSVVPELDTPVCDQSTRHFENVAAQMGYDVAIVTISVDDPFTQDRWGRENRILRHRLLSDHRDKGFAKAYGLYVKETGYLARSVLVIDRAGVIRYIETQQEMARIPNFDAAVQKVRELQGR